MTRPGRTAMHRATGAALLLPAALAAGCAPNPADEAAGMLQGVLQQHRASVAAAGAAAPATTTTTPPNDPEARPLPASRLAAPAQAAQLLGVAPDMLLRWLGQPRLRRQDGTAEIWHYQTDSCHLDIILYRDISGPPRVAWAAARASGAERRTEAACLREISAGFRPTPASAV